MQTYEELINKLVADNPEGTNTYRQPVDDEIGWDYIPFADDAVIDSWEREEIK